MLASLSLIFTANNPRQPQVNTRNRSPVPHDQGEAAVGHHLTRRIGMSIFILCFTWKTVLA